MRCSCGVNQYQRHCPPEWPHLRAPTSRTDSSRVPLFEVLGRALANASGEEYQPPRLAEIEDLLGSDNFKQLMTSPRIKQAVRLWANASDADRPKVTKNLATLIADEIDADRLQLN